MLEGLYKWAEERQARMQRFSPMEIEAEVLRQEIKELKENGLKDDKPEKEAEDAKLCQKWMDTVELANNLRADAVTKAELRKRAEELHAQMGPISHLFGLRARYHELRERLSEVERPAMLATKNRDMGQAWWRMMVEMKETGTVPDDAEERVQKHLEWLREVVDVDKQRFRTELSYFRMKWPITPWVERKRMVPALASYAARHLVWRAAPRRLQIGSARMLVRLLKK